MWMKQLLPPTAMKFKEHQNQMKNGSGDVGIEWACRQAFIFVCLKTQNFFLKRVLKAQRTEVKTQTWTNAGVSNVRHQ